MSRTQPNFSTLLEQIGFEQTVQGAEILWKAQSGGTSLPGHSKIEILQRKDRFTLEKCSLAFDLNKLKHAFEGNSRKKFQKVVSSVTKINDYSDIQIVLEIGPNQAGAGQDQRAAQSNPGTILGWTTSLSINQARLTLQITNAFMIGAPIKDWWSQIGKIVTESFAPGSSGIWNVSNLFELTLPVYLMPTIHKLDQTTFNLLMDSKHESALRVPRPLSMEIHSSRIHMTLSSPDDLLEEANPIEILAARETSSFWLGVDRAIFNRQLPQVPNGFREQSQSCIMARIAARPCLVEQLPPSNNLDFEPADEASLTVATGYLMTLQYLSRSREFVKILSHVLRKISSTYGDFNNLTPMRNILPEILGDAWSTVDPNFAFRSWDMALLQKPNNLRILHKIATLARDTGNSNKELHTQLKICQTERRTDALKSATLRLIEIQSKNLVEDHETKVELRRVLEIAARKTEFNETIVANLSKILCGTGEHLKALSLLDSCIQSNGHQLSSAQISELHSEVARIWHKYENNTPLATARFITATTEPRDPTDQVLDDAENFFSQTGNAHQMKRVLLLRANRPGRPAPIEVLERSAKYLNKMNHHADAISAIVELMRMKRYQQWYCDIILDASVDISIDWTEITKLMDKADETQLPKDALPMWRLITGRCAMKSSESWEIGVKHFTDRQVVKLLSEDESRHVISQLITHQSRDILSKFIVERMVSAKDSESQYLLHTIVTQNLTSVDGLFESALAEHAKSLGSFDLSLLRLENLLSKNDSQTAGNLVQSHVDTITTTTMLNSFLDQAINRLCDSENTAFSDILSSLFKTRQERAPIDDFAREIMIDKLIRKQFISVAADILRSSIEAGELGLRNQTVIHELFSNEPQLVAKWHFSAMLSETKSESRYEHAKHCSQFWLMTESRPKELVDAIVTIGSFDILDTPNLVLLESLCKRENKLQMFLDVLITQMAKNEKDSQDLLYWAIRIINTYGLERDVAARLYEKRSAGLNEHSTHKLYSQAQLWLSAKNLQESQRHFTTLLGDPEVLKEPHICFSALDGLAKTRPQRAHFASTVQSLISWAQNSDQPTLAEKLIDKSIELEIATLEHIHARITQKFDTFPASQIASIAIQGLTKSERSASSVVKLLDEWKAATQIAERPEKWREVISCLTADHLLRQLRQAARCEIQLIHAKNLFEDETKRLDAIPHFEMIALENPLDSRTWIPLYSLYEECGAKQKMIAHLERIIPLIEREPSLLEKTPFNIESLKSTLSRARKSVIEAGGLGGDEFRPSTSQNPSTFELNNHAARLQRGWIDAIPVVKIAAVSSDGSETPTHQKTVATATDQQIMEPQTGFDGSAAQNLDQVPLDYQITTSQDNVIPATASKVELSVVTNAKTNPSRELINWREIALKAQAPKGSTKKVMTMAFASELEKHIAVQTIALLTGETAELVNWHWQVWRQSEDFQYQTTDSGRLPKEIKLTQYGGQLHKLIKMVTPVVLRMNKDKFLADRHLRKIGLQGQQSSRHVDLTHPALKRGYIAIFRNLIDSSRIKFFDTPGLGSDVFFDLSERGIHFDGKWQLELPPTVLTYRAIENVLHFRKGVPGIAMLNPETDIVPVIQNIRDVLASSGINRLRIAFGIDHAQISEQLKSINRDQLISLLGWNSDKTIDDIRTLQQEMRYKAYADLLVTTLDLVGISESLTGSNLCDKTNQTDQSNATSHPIIEFLINLATKLKI